MPHPRDNVVDLGNIAIETSREGYETGICRYFRIDIDTLVPHEDSPEFILIGPPNFFVAWRGGSRQLTRVLANSINSSARLLWRRQPNLAERLTQLKRRAAPIAHVYQHV